MLTALAISGSLTKTVSDSSHASEIHYKPTNKNYITNTDSLLMPQMSAI